MKQSTHTAHQGIHAKVCHISLDQSVEISSYMEQQTPGSQNISGHETSLIFIIHYQEGCRALLLNEEAEKRE